MAFLLKGDSEADDASAERQRDEVPMDKIVHEHSRVPILKGNICMGVKKPKDIRLSSLLTEKFISLELKGNNKKKLIAELVELIAKSRKLRNKKAFYKAILEREKLGSTGIGYGVAIPHAKSEGVSGFILAFARKDEGIDFGALDGEKTYLFFAFASPKNEVEGHLKILAEISRLVKDKFMVELLRQAKDKKEVLKIISDSDIESRPKH